MKTSGYHSRTKRQQLLSLFAVLAVCAVATFAAFARARSASVAVGGGDDSAPAPSNVGAHGEEPADEGGQAPAAPAAQSDPTKHEPSDGCMKCHTGVGDPHASKLGGTSPSCVDCHGGNGTAATRLEAHTAKPKHPDKWPSSANPEETFTLLNDENWDWIRFVNPSDLRVAMRTCGRCHEHEGTVRALLKSAMTNSPQVYSTALYNNGSLPTKDAIIGENYSPSGQPQIARTIPPPTAQEQREQGLVPFLLPFPRFEIGQPLSVAFWRPFERGGGPKSETGNPNREDVPGQPDVTLSNRGYGTQARVDPVILGAQKVRLNDPVMSFMGTNNAPGDYRQSGCAACHVVYANDRSEYNSGPYARFGNRGYTAPDNPDPNIPKNESGHPLQHKFTKSIPSSQCITCHVHNGNGFINTYLGYMWWDEQSDGEFLYPKRQKNPTPEELDKAGRFNPEEAAARGNWGDPEFLFEMSKLNPKLRHVQLSDYHGHGWVFRRAYKMDRKGQFLDKDGRVISYDDPDLYEHDGKPGKAVHLKDIHLERGMHCVDCHFTQDNHGTGKIYGDRRAVIEISCEDCHGTVNKRVTAQTIQTSGFGPNEGSHSRMIPRRAGTPFNRDRFLQRGDKLIQRSMVEQTDPATGKALEWEVPQVLDTITPGNPRYNAKSARAKTMLRDNETWGAVPADSKQLAHDSSRVSCVSCHSSWTTNCWGCHLSAAVNTKKPMLHEEGDETQVYPSYNPQVLRTDGYMLGIDGSVQGHKVMPVRSSSAVTVSVTNAARSVIVNHAPTISSAGYNGNAFNTHPPHTVRATETKQCTDCHVSKENDNNAWVGSVLMQGSNQVNFMGRFIYTAEGKDGLSATMVAEQTEPQAVIGGHLHQIAYPDWYARHEARGMKLRENYAHRSNDVEMVQQYGEFLLAAAGSAGVVVYDAANVADKDFSQRIVDSPFSAAGQKLYVRTKDATGVAVGSPAPLDPSRNPGQTEDQRKWLEVNEEKPLAPLFGYAFVSDRQEGLVVVDITTLTDGVNTNNHLKRGAAYNPEGRLSNARGVWVVGNYAYVLTERALQVVNIGDPLRPAWVSETPLRDPRSLAVQFRYCFVTDADGLKVLDVTDLEHPRAVANAVVPLRDAHGVYASREYAYVGAGQEGLAIVDIQRPEQPRIDQMFNDGGKLNDTRDAKVGMSYASLIAYVADGKNGMKVVELTNPNTVPGNLGYSPRPAPRVVAYYPTKGPALQVSEGYRRDRAVDESGNQIAVFGRRGARPFNLEEQRRMYLHDGKLYTVTDEPGRPTAAKTAQAGSWLQSLSRLFGAGLGWLGVFVIFPAALVRLKRRGVSR
jgi:LVIVD repeat